MNRTIRHGLGALALLGVVSATSAFAASATRSADELPLPGSTVGSVPYVKGMEKSWRCSQVSDKGLNLKQSLVRTDRIGRVVLGAKGNPFTCTMQADNTAADGSAADPAAGAAVEGTSEFVGAAVFPIEIIAGVVGGGAVGAAVVGSGSSDSPG